MLKKKTIMVCLAALSVCLSAFAQQQEQEKPDPLDFAEKEVERLERELKLEDWQTFYVDSILTYNYSELFREMEEMQKAHVANPDMYMTVQDKWMIRTEEAYKKVMTEEQWQEYLKQGGARIIKEREKRLEKMQATKDKKKKKK